MAAKKPRRLNIGAHMSIAGGIDLAPVRGKEVGCESIQVFVKSNRQWRVTDLTDEEVERFKENCTKNEIGPVVAHISYLLNLGSPDGALYKKSRDCFLVELERAHRLGIAKMVMHPGAHGGSGEKACLARIADAITWLLDQTSGRPIHILLETTAGQGSSVGYRFEHLADIIRRSKRVGVCFDTAHVFAAGYDIKEPEGFHRTMEELDRVVGLKRLEAFHLNDSKSEMGSRVDRHEHIGMGRLGDAVFREILHDKRFEALPKVLETPKGDHNGRRWDAINLERLRRLAAE